MEEYEEKKNEEILENNDKEKNEKKDSQEPQEIKEENNILKEKLQEVKEKEKQSTKQEILPQEEIKEEDKKAEEQISEQEDKKNKTRSLKKWIIIPSVILFVILVLTTIFAVFNMKNNNIISGITINGTSIQGISKEEAKKKIQEKMNLENSKLVNLKAEDFEYSLEGSQIELSYNIEETIENAYKIGRNSNIFINNYEIISAKVFGKEFNLQMTYNEELLNAIINDIAVKIPNAVTESSYYIDGDKLVITKGKAGNAINIEKTKENILNKLKDNDEKVIILEIQHAEPKKIDIEKVYNEIHTEPKDAYYTKEPFEVFSHVDGVDFDLNLAKETLKEDKEEYIINLTITHPTVTISDIGTEAFPDLLGSFSTKYNGGNVNRTTNLKLAASRVNGTVVAPGETFSYNRTVGERTISAGYKDAAGYSGGEVVDMLGGGICQISSTLYDAVVYSNLEIVSRKNHAFLTSYTTAGRDATVVYGSIDFKFKNTRKYPILIKMSVQNGIAKAEIYGIKEVEYQIDIDTTILSYLTYTTIYKDDESLEAGIEKTSQGGMNGCKSITYKVKKLNGVEVSKEVLSTDTYNPMNRIVRRGITIETQPIEEENVPQVEERTQPEPPKVEEKQNIMIPTEENVMPPETPPTVNEIISNTNN